LEEKTFTAFYAYTINSSNRNVGAPAPNDRETRELRLIVEKRKKETRRRRKVWTIVLEE
jgi:hypothetical protein